MGSKLVKRSTAKDRHGLAWEIALVPTARAVEEDFDFWFTKLTPEQRVEAVHSCLISTLMVRGIYGTPRLRRIARRIQHRTR